MRRTFALRYWLIIAKDTRHHTRKGIRWLTGITRTLMSLVLLGIQQPRVQYRVAWFLAILLAVLLVDALYAPHHVARMALLIAPSC